MPNRKTKQRKKKGVSDENTNDVRRGRYGKAISKQV